MLEGFESLDSTKIGRIAERIGRAYRHKVRNQAIHKDLDIEYDSKRDMIFLINGEEIQIEFKGDNYPSGNNLPIEIMQEDIKGEMVTSGIGKTTSNEWDVYCFRKDTIYVFEPIDVDRIVYDNIVRDYHYKECNKNSGTGKTICIVIDIDLLEQCGFFKAKYTNVLEALDKAGISREDLGIEGLEKED